MSLYLYIATSLGLFIAVQTDGDWRIHQHALTNTALTSVAVSEETILAGGKKGIRRSTDNGQTWHDADSGLEIPHVRWLAHVPGKAGLFLAGTEPAGIFVSSDGGESWQANPEVAALREKHGWFLPYSPEPGCVRGFAAAGTGSSGRIYAAVEVGGVLVSSDGGDAWQLVEGSDGKPAMDRDLGPMVHPDVHSLTVHPSAADLVTAATGGGLYRSSDGGRTWERLYRCYIRAVWVDPDDPDHIIAGPADGVSRNGRIEESDDGGKTWRDASQGLETPWPGDMVVRFLQSGGELFAVLSSGELWSRSLDAPGWKRVLPELPDVNAVAVGRQG